MTILPSLKPDHCGCDVAGQSAALISIDEALQRIDQNVVPVTGTEIVPLASATGRILARAIKATMVAPLFDNAAMDGYAVDSRALSASGPWQLSVIDRIPAGKAAAGRIDGAAARIFTGAPVPAGADAVVQQEHVVRDGGIVTLRQRPSPGMNIRRIGSDMQPGQTVVERGRQLGVREISACAAAGVSEVEVRRVLRAGLLVTGNEIRQAGSERQPAQIWDVNTPMLCSALSGPEIDLVQVRQVGDDLSELRQCLADLSETTDLIVTTGGISVGEEDHVKPALTALGTEIIFTGVAIKPGKPVSFGRLGRSVWLGLPGNPLSAFVTWQMFGLPLVDSLLGADCGARKRRHVVTGGALVRKPGRCELRSARIVGFDADGREVVAFDDTINSARVTSLPDADGMILISAETEQLPQGALIEFLPFRQF